MEGKAVKWGRVREGETEVKSMDWRSSGLEKWTQGLRGSELERQDVVVEMWVLETEIEVNTRARVWPWEWMAWDKEIDRIPRKEEV